MTNPVPTALPLVAPPNRASWLWTLVVTFTTAGVTAWTTRTMGSVRGS
jgi:hypothetical protein